MERMSGTGGEYRDRVYLLFVYRQRARVVPFQSAIVLLRAIIAI